MIKKLPTENLPAGTNDSHLRHVINKLVREVNRLRKEVDKMKDGKK